MRIYKPKKHPKNTAKSFRDYSDDADVIRSQFHLLRDIWDPCRDIASPQYNFLAFRDVATGEWIEHAVKFPASAVEIEELLTRYSRWKYDLYFCPNAFSRPRRRRQYALPTRFGWCDIDASNPDDYDPWPSLAWETSPGRFQGLWVWDETHTASDAEKFSKALAYRHGGDKNGWSATKVLRLNGSVNHKPHYDEPFIQTVHCDWTEIASRPVPLEHGRHSSPVEVPSVDADPTKHDRADVIKRYRKELHPKVRYLIGNRKVYEPDRSAQIFHMIAGLHEAGASPDEIACVLWDSPYFVERHGQDLNKINGEIARVIGKLGGKK